MTFERIGRHGSIVKIIAQDGVEFIGKLLPMYYLIKENGSLSVELYVSQHEQHKGPEFGCAGFALEDIKQIEVLQWQD